MPDNSLGASAEAISLPLAGTSQGTVTPGELTHYFISYSRQEVSFADSLARE